MAKKIIYSFLAAFLFMNAAMAQVLTVTGKVTDENGIPVSSVSIIEKGKASSGVTTNENGAFTISVTKGTTLIFTAVGYDSRQVVANSATLAVAMATSVKGLSEVVVTGFGGTQIKKDLTGNIARVKSKDIEYLPTPTVDQALQGKAAGVFVNSQSGKLGQAVTVRVRGNSSISASSQPLYVLDGVPITSNSQSGYGGAMNPLVDINPNDIESIEVLKDASAGAIFGSRAANGVVLITTKRGKAGRTQVTLNVQTGYAEATKRVEMLNSTQYAELALEGAKYRDDLAGIAISNPNSFTSGVKAFMDEMSYGQWSGDPSKTYDWQDNVFQRAPYQQADLQIRGGTDRTKFFASFQHLDQTGTLIGNNLKRSTGRLSLDQKANDWLDIGMTLNLARTWQRRLPGDNAFSNPLQAIALMPMSPFTDPNTGLPSGAPPGDVNIPVYYNPVLSVNYGNFTQTVFRTFGNAYARAKILPGLFLNSEFGIDYLSQNEEGYFQSQTIRNQSRAARGVGTNGGAFVTNINTNNYLNYTKAFGKHRIDGTVGMQFQNSLSKYNFTEGLDFPSDAYQKIASAATKSGGSSSETEFSFLSYFARANYSLMDKYLFSASIRRDGSSRFGNAKPYGNFPAVSAGWVLSNENFMSSIDFLSFLKLRASWGLVGNSEIGNFPARTLITGDAGYTGNPGLRPSQLGNSDLGWETTEQVDIGVDFGLFKNRITGEIDYYKKKTSDLLLAVNIPITSGFGSVTRNLGQLTNEGFEFVLNTQNTVGAFKWSTNINAAKNMNTVTNIAGQVIEGGVSNMNRVVEGAAIGVFYTVEFAGVDPANGNALFYKNTKKADGSFDKSTTATYSEAQRVVVGNPTPDWIWGFTNNFSFKGFDLSVFFNGVVGNQVNIYGMGRYSSANMLYEDNNTVDQLARWQKPGDVTNVPQVRLYRVNGSQASSRYIVNGDYIRLRTASLGYTFNTNWLKKAKIERLRVYVQAFNLLTITDYPYWDPEVNADDFDSNIAKGNDFYTPPQPRTILFGINLNF